MRYDEDVKDIMIKKDQGVQFLNFIKQRRIPVVIDGTECPYKESEYICKVFEDDNYMRDYIVNENGSIKQVHLDKIKRYHQ